MKNENATTEIQGTKRLSLEDFKLEKLNSAEVLSAQDLNNALGGVSQEVLSFICFNTGKTLDDCHS